MAIRVFDGFHTLYKAKKAEVFSKVTQPNIVMFKLSDHWFGSGSISGVVTEAGSNIRRQVFLYDRRARRAIRKTWSDPVTGEYTFANIRTDIEYFIIAQDHERDYNAVIADFQQAT